MYCVIFITTKDKEEAEEIAQGLLSEELIACANIISGVKSLFWWQGRIDSANEVLLICKSKRQAFKKIVKAVRSLHSYDVPEIIALPIIDGHKDYLKWVNDSMKPTSPTLR